MTTIAPSAPAPAIAAAAAAPPAAVPHPITGHDPVKQWPTPPAMTIKPGIDYSATLATTDGNIGVQLLPGIAPNAVNNFMFLAKNGFYKDVPIHRMIPGFMFQSGDPTGTGMGGPGYDLPDDKVPAGLSYGKGIVAMANTGQPNSGGSQFFVMLGDAPLPPTYSIFGYVKSGADVLDKINARPVADNGFGEVSKPVDPIGLTDITISEAPAAPPKPQA
jgi:cyclophilin family peptidyl-prolyl cis-trans isomerase